MNAAELYQAGRLDEAIAALGDALRGDPSDVRRRTFLFELLCFAGELDRAEKHLNILADGGKDAGMGAMLYRSALHAERTRRDVFAPGGMPPASGSPKPVRGTLNGEPFEFLADADPRIGARLEIFAAGQYTWLPYEQITSVSAAPPKRLRDLLWLPAIVHTVDNYEGVELGEILLPVLTPDAHTNTDPAIRLGRLTDIDTLEDGTSVPVGQKLLLVDDADIPILEVRELVIAGPAGS